MAVTEKNSSPGAAPLLSRTSSPLRTHRPPADFKFKSPSPARGHCPLQGHNDTPPSFVCQAPAASPGGDEDQDSFPNFIRSKTEEYSKRIRKLQDDYLYPLKEDLAEWINRVLQTSDLTAENFIEKLDNGVLILRMAKIIESQCNMFEDIGTLSLNGNTINGSATTGNTGKNVVNGNNIKNTVQSNGVGRPGKGSNQQDSDSGGCNRLDNDQSDCSSPPTPTPRPRRCHRVLQSSLSTTTSSSSPTSSLSPSSSPVSRSFSPFSKSHPLSPFSSSSGQMLIHGKLAHLNQSRQQQQFNSSHTSANLCNTPFKICSIKAWENAKSQSFYARDNVCNFIKWCRFLQVREAVIFESEDLVLHNNQRNVILCLLEVARIVCTKYGFDHVPGLVQLEKEIDQEIEREEQAKQQAGNNCNNGNDCHHYQDVAVEAIEPASKPLLRDSHTDPSSAKSQCDMQTTTDSLHTGKHLVDNWSSTDCGRSPSPAASSISMTSGTVSEIASTPDPVPRHQDDQSIGSAASSQSSDPRIKASQLDQKVMLIAKSFYGKKHNRIQRLEEGKYRISGKIVFVRLLRDRHVMVRVGGGWDTLPHFLERHGLEEDISAVDISPSDLLPMDTRPSETKRRDYNSPLLNKSLSTILFKSPSASNSFASAAPLASPLSPSLSQMPQALDMGSPPGACITSSSALSKSSSASSHSQLARSVSVNAHTTVPKVQRVNGSRSSIPTTPGSSLRSSASPMYRSPSASSIPILLRRCSSSAPLSRRTASRQVN